MNIIFVNVIYKLDSFMLLCPNFLLLFFEFTRKTSKYYNNILMRLYKWKIENIL